MNLKGLSKKELKRKRDHYWKKVKSNADKIDYNQKVIKRGYVGMKSRYRYNNAKSTLPSLKKRKIRAKTKYRKYHLEIVDRSEQMTRKKQRKNAYKIAKKTKGSKYTSIYRSDHKNHKVIKLVETSPNESESFDVANESIDDSASQVTQVGTQPISLSGTYYIIGYSEKSRSAQYNQLRRWRGIELVVDGFTHWEHALITSISKTASQESSANTLEVSLNFQYVNKARIQFAKQTKGAKRKPKGKVKSGRR